MNGRTKGKKPYERDDGERGHPDLGVGALGRHS